MVNMPDSKVLNRIIEQADNSGLWDDSVQPDELRIVVKSSGDELVVTEPAAERWADIWALNFVTLVLWDPAGGFGMLREEAPNNGDELLENRNFGVVNGPAPQLKDGQFDVCRTRGFVRNVADLAGDLADDPRQENYTYRVFRLLADTERDLNIGVNPLGNGVKEFYGRGGPVKIAADDPEENEGEDVGSAAQADW
jgi:hypothetical protein